MVEHLAKNFQEAQVAFGVTGRGALVEVLTTEGGETWSIIFTSPNGVSCLVASGEGWRTKELESTGIDPDT